MTAARTILRLWLAASAALLAGILVWAFAPVVLFAMLLAGALGVLSIVMIKIARGLEAWRARREP